MHTTHINICGLYHRTTLPQTMQSNERKHNVGTVFSQPANKPHMPLGVNERSFFLKLLKKCPPFKKKKKKRIPVI